MSSIILSVLSRLRSHNHSSAPLANIPTLQFEPLSPARVYAMCPSGARFVGPNEAKSTGLVGGYEGCEVGWTIVSVGGSSFRGAAPFEK